MLTVKKSARIAIAAAGLGLGLGLAGAAAAQSIQYTYDALGRVTRADYGNGKTVSYAYDSAGNRTSTSTTGFPAAPVKIVVLPLLGGLVIPLPN
ncbi:MAG TPA: RHS repeat domain-containing protein [Caulobacter sp.]|nr:RHS repeat domain-containing protein [Caulobacter sp.]